MNRHNRKLAGPAHALVVWISFGLSIGSAHAATFVVNDTGDQGDTVINGTCDAVGPANCTLRAAIEEANAAAGLDTINFNILPAGPKIISTTGLPNITSPVIINATTQPGFAGTPIVELNGTAAGGASGLNLSTGSGGSTVRGLVIDQFGGHGIRILAGTMHTIAGNYVGTDVTGTLPRGNSVGIFIQTGSNQIGGTAVADRNVISSNAVDGIQIVGASSNRIEGNFIGLDATGTADLGNTNTGVAIFGGSTNTTVGGTAPGAGNVISGNNLHGVGFGGVGTTGNRIEGNLIGTNAAGTASIPNASGVDIAVDASGNIVGGTAAGARNVISGNGGNGIGVASASNQILGNYIGTNPAADGPIANGTNGINILSNNNTVGGTTPAARNIVSGNGDDGIEFFGASAAANLIQGNFVGVAADGTTPISNKFGVHLNANSNNNTIGGIAAGAANRISGNTNDGVLFSPTAGIGNSILSNQIFSNGGLGIDFNDDGVTPNDALDADSGPNDLMNFPDIAAVIESAGTLTATFWLDVPAASYRIEFFKNPLGADASGNGEGQAFASSFNVVHPGGGPVSFNHSFSGVAGDVITATATPCTDGAICNAFGSTSEFSNAFSATTTAVKLMSFTAVGSGQAVDLSWRTGSELNNLGFHLFRSRAANGTYERITESIIPGLGSSPEGATYAYRDSGLDNGTEYFYKLQDIEASGRTELHGPAFATPAPQDDGETSFPEEEARVTFGDPSQVSLRVTEWGQGGASIELQTGGFVAIPRSDGSVRLAVPGFEELRLAGLPAVPVKRARLEAIAGRGVRIVSVRELELVSFTGLLPDNAGVAEIVASSDGTVRAGSRRTQAAPPTGELFPASAAQLLEVGFQAEVKKALVELAPLRWDARSRRLVLARRLEVRVSFAGVEKSEKSLGGSRGRRHREDRSYAAQAGRSVLARLAVSKPGLYRMSFDELFRFQGRRARPVSVGSLRLSRQGEAVAFHVEPPHDDFGPGSVLYFVSEGESLNPYGKDAVYELETGSAGRVMSMEDATPTAPQAGLQVRAGEWEENRYYLPALREASSPWFWDILIAPSVKRYPFRLSAWVDESARLSVWLQGASDFAAAPDHHVRVSVNGIPVEEVRWDGKSARTIECNLSRGILREGENELAIDNVGDTGARYSMVLLDRFAVTYVRQPIVEAGVLEGRFDAAGTVEVHGSHAGSVVVRKTPEPTWLRGVRATANGVSFRAETERDYLVVSPEAVLEATVRPASPPQLANTRNQADYLLIGPREFLQVAQPLVELRRRQGLAARAVAVEDVYDEFGFGEARPEAVKAFLEYAYQNWRVPSVRYVLLLGDATYDGKDYLGTGGANRVPALMVKTSYLWTASDPTYAATNGGDGLPDIALGRLPAANIEEARVLVTKTLQYEDSEQSLSAPVVLVADDPDPAGDFEADSEEIAAAIAGREIDKIYLRKLGREATRTAILEAFDRGASLVSYAGHGGIAVWAGENVLENSDIDHLGFQDRQPILVTMNCLNGYFHFPYSDSLAEALIKAEGKGAIAAFSPSGLSLNQPAHRYRQALMDELSSGQHTRLGDAVLAAQETYADSGAFPELLRIYHLFGDPALELQP